MAQYKKEDIIDSIVKMRINEMASTRTIIKDYLQDKLGYGQTYAYELYKEARILIKEYYKSDNIASTEEAIGQLEQMAETAKGEKNYKLAFEIRKELNKIVGAYADIKVDVTGELNHNVTVIKLRNVNGTRD